MVDLCCKDLGALILVRAIVVRWKIYLKKLSEMESTLIVDVHLRDSNLCLNWNFNFLTKICFSSSILKISQFGVNYYLMMKSFRCLDLINAVLYLVEHWCSQHFIQGMTTFILEHY